MIRVSAGIIRKEGKILICRRGQGRKHAGLWEFPGGKQEAGETAADCLARELQEELGIAASESDLEPVGVQKISYGKVFYKKPFRDRELADLYLFRKPVDTDTLRLQKGEVEEVRWFPADYVLQKARTEPDHREFCIYPEEVEKIIQALEA